MTSSPLAIRGYDQKYNNCIILTGHRSIGRLLFFHARFLSSLICTCMEAKFKHHSHTPLVAMPSQPPQPDLYSNFIKM